MMFFADLIRFPGWPERGPADREPWVTETALARYFAVATRTVRRWRAKGMPSATIGGTRRYRVSACEAWLTQERKR